MKWGLLSLPVKIGLGVVVLVGVLLMDDAEALFARALNAPWVFAGEDARPDGAWKGVLDGAPGGPRQLELRLHLKEWDGSSSDKAHGYFVRRPWIGSRGGGAMLEGEMVVTDAQGRRDRYEVEGPPDFRGRQVSLNLHGAMGTAGVMLEKAEARFAEGKGALTIRYRVPVGAIARPGPVFSYMTGGVQWTEALGPAAVVVGR